MKVGWGFFGVACALVCVVSCASAPELERVDGDARGSLEREEGSQSAAKYACVESGMCALDSADFGEALAFHKERCERGSAVSCNALGVMHLDGLGVSSSPLYAMTFFDRACRGGLGFGCGNFAYVQMVYPQESGRSHLALRGDGGSGWKRALVERAQMGCDQRSGAGCTALGMFLLEEARAKKSAGVQAQRATIALKTGCMLKNGTGCAELGAVYADQTPPNLDEAKRWWTRGCDVNDSSSCYLLGARLLQGDTQEQERGVHILDRLCQLNAPQACSLISSHIIADRALKDVPPEALKRAITWANRACTLSQAQRDPNTRVHCVYAMVLRTFNAKISAKPEMKDPP